MQIITVTAFLIGLFLVLKYSTQFRDALGAAGSVFTQGVGALMGPNNITKGGG
jgi:hypothetical protein